jgi:hypothetical protein
MPRIPQEIANNMFQTALTDSDKAALQRIVRCQVGNMRSELEQGDYPEASRCWNFLKQLRIIEHSEIAELMQGQVIPQMRTHAAERTATFNEYASQHNFTEAERLLALLHALNEHFPDENLVDLGNLNATLNTAREQHTAQQKAQEEARRAQENAQKAQEEARRAQENAQKAQEEARRAQENTQRAQEEARREREELEALERRRQAELDAERERRQRGNEEGIYLQ